VACEDSYHQQLSERELSQQEPSNQVDDEAETIQILEEQIDKED
jgi:hypothetical protein